jgi:hypothetical protein
MSIHWRRAQPDAHFQKHRAQAETADSSRHIGASTSCAGGAFASGPR